MLVLFLAFFAFLHCWLNAFAEMLRFADRMFYKVHFCHCQAQKPFNVFYWFVLYLLSENFYFIFYLQDWWNSTSFANYYRTWNVVVHDWLYYYMYRDFLWVGGYLQNMKENYN